jgi:hypothetical protein
MASEQENYRREQLQSSLQNTARSSQRVKEQMESALSAYQRDKAMIDSRLTDTNLTDSDFLHNGAQSVTIGEAKSALRAVFSYAHHAGEISESKAKTLMADCGISDNTILPTADLAAELEPLRI